jgi:hypothetical protein
MRVRLALKRRPPPLRNVARKNAAGPPFVVFVFVSAGQSFFVSGSFFARLNHPFSIVLAPISQAVRGKCVKKNSGSP